MTEFFTTSPASIGRFRSTEDLDDYIRRNREREVAL